MKTGVMVIKKEISRWKILATWSRVKISNLKMRVKKEERKRDQLFFFFRINYTFLRCYVEWSASWQLQ